LPVWVHKFDQKNLEEPGSDGLPIMGVIEAVKADGILEDGQKVVIGELEFEVIFTPGHSPGGVSFYFEKEKVLFSGDTLFKGTHGNISFPTSNQEDMRDSLLRLMKLPNDVRVYPGHMEDTTIGEERRWICH
jgi:glyoxylase-like metal-dependent hydrolase (beta-lactamase superfamily II)